MATVVATVRLANRDKVPVVLNPSPLIKGFPWGELALDTLIVNAGEARAIFKLDPAAIRLHLQAWRKTLHKLRVERLMITRGAQATLCLTESEFLQVPTMKVRPVDTVGAGDAFAGALVAHLARGVHLLQAIRLANCAAALTTLKPGAQEAIPDVRETKRALRRLR